MKKSFFLLSALFFLISCGGGGGGTSAPSSPGGNVSALTVSGTASEGALITGKTVKLKDANGNSAVDAITNATTGNYSIDVTNLTAPFLVTVTGTNGTYISLAQASGTANINPITTMVVVLAAGTSDVSALFAGITPAQVITINTNYAAKCALVTSSLQAALPAGVTAGSYFTVTVTAGTGMDAIFDTYQIVVHPTAGITVKTKDASATTCLTIPVATITANTTEPLLAINVPTTPTPTPTPPAPSTYTISGKVASLSGAGFSGVTVSLTGASTTSTTTDASGNYAFSGAQNGSYTITPSHTGTTFSPTSKSITVSGANITGQDFTTFVNITFVNNSYTKGLSVTDKILKIIVTVTSTFSINSVIAKVEGRTAALAFTENAYNQTLAVKGPAWIGTIDLIGLTEDTKTITITATDAYGSIGTTTANFVYDNKPTISVIEPLDYSVATPTIRIAASCSDTKGNCISLQAAVIGEDGRPLVVLSDPTSLDQIVSLTAYNGKQISISIVGTDSAGQTTTITRNIYVESSERLAKVADLPGLIWDYGADGRTLYIDTSDGGSALKIKDTISGTITTIFAQVGQLNGYGFLSPKGAIFMEQSGNVLTAKIHEWRDGNLIDLAYGPWFTIKGNYAIYFDNPDCIRLNLLTGTKLTDATCDWNDVDTYGNIALVATGTNGKRQIFKYDGINRIQITNDSVLSNDSPLIDGDYMVYYKQAAGTPPAYYSIAMFNSASGETILSTNSSFEGNYPFAGSDYMVSNGWIAFSKYSLDGTKQIWVRSPSGVNEQCTYFGNPSLLYLKALAPTGEVILHYRDRLLNEKLYSYQQGGFLVELSSTLLKPIYVDNRWCAIIGRSVFSLDTSP